MNSKFVFYILFLTAVYSLRAQEIRGFGSFAGYISNDEFKRNTIFEAGAGIECSLNEFIKPEISVSYFFMGLKDEKWKESQDVAILKKNAAALGLSFAPKIYFWKSIDEEGSETSYFAAPKFSMSRIMASGMYTSGVNSERQKIGDWQHFFGLSLGMDFPLSEANSNSLAFTLNFTKLDFGKTLKRLRHNEADYNDAMVGFTAIYYFGL